MLNSIMKKDEPVKVNTLKNKETIKISTIFLSIYFVLAPLDFFPILPGVSISKIFIFLPLIGSMFYLKYFRIYIDKYFVITIIYLLMIMISSTYSYETTMTIQRISTVGLNITVILILSMIKYNNREIKMFIKSFVLSGWVTLGLMVFYSNTDFFDGRLTVIINGVKQDPNYMTGFLIFTIIYYINSAFKEKKISALVKICILIYFLMLTGSRGGILAIFAAILFFIFSHLNSEIFKITKIIKNLFVFGFIIMLIYFFIDFLPASIVQRLDIRYTIEDGGAGRTGIWKSIWENFKESPTFNQFFGWGAGTVTFLNPGRHVAHNIWLETLIEIGIIGFITLLIYYYTFIKKAIKLNMIVISSTFIGYMAMSLSMSLYSYKPIWNIILLIMILKNYNKDSNK